MSDEPTFDFLAWEELPVGVRRNRKKMYNYLVSVLGGDTPGPTGTGTVTVTCQDSSENKLENAYVGLLVEQGGNPVAVGYTDNTGTVILKEEDGQGEPTGTTANVPFGTYYLYAESNDTSLAYSTDEFVVDGDENVTITLTVPTHNGTVEVHYRNGGSWTPIPNATVEIGDSDAFETPLYSGTTDSNGVANFTMPYDEYYVRVTATGYTQDGDEYWSFDDTQPTSSIILIRDGD